MLSTKKLTGLVLACGLALWLPMGCSDDDSGSNNNQQSLCGNGQIDEGEECDGTNLNGDTCLDHGYTGGTLDCTAECQFDESHCISTAECGNGKVESGEDCDCGTDPDNLPAGCPAINGGEDGNCDATCHTSGTCSANAWETCDPSTLGDCCPDTVGSSYDCTALGSTSLCLMPCDSTDQCYYNNQCEQTNLQGHCWPALCGPGSDQYIGGIGGDLNTTCQVPGGGEGWCFPINTADQNFAFCWESGTAEQGEACTQIPDDGDIFTTLLARDDTSVTLCDQGLCLSDGTCAKFCDWQDVYANGETCPTGTNCFPQTFFYSEDPNDPNDDDMDGHRWADEAICLTIDSDPQNGVVTCDLLTGETIADRSKTCADFDPDPNNNQPMECVLYNMSSDPNVNEMSASLIGLCTEVQNAPNKAVYEACDPSQSSTDVCPEGTICQPDDMFANPDQPAEQAHCLPLCDTEGTACTDAHTELPAGFTCTSFSTLFAPGTNPGTTTDGSPSRLGVCACPPSGCPTAPQCGNGVVENGEDCDGTDLNGQDCTTIGGGFTGGTLACDTNTCTFDTSGCTNN